MCANVPTATSHADGCYDDCILPALRVRIPARDSRPVLRPRWQLHACRTRFGEAIPGSCAIRGPREGCGVFSVRLDAVPACPGHPVRLGETVGMSPVAGFPTTGHGPCHRPACPSCHGGQAQSSEGCFLPAVSQRLGDALSGTVWWPSSSGRTPIEPPIFARFADHAKRSRAA